MSSDGPFAHDALCRIVIDAIQQFHLCGFQTIAVVADGAPSNLKMIKEMSGACNGAYGLVCTIIHVHQLTTSFFFTFAALEPTRLLLILTMSLPTFSLPSRTATFTL